MQFSRIAAVSVAIGLAGSAAFAGPVDLTTWAGPEGSGNWTIGVDNKSVYQSVNTSNPTVFHSGVNSQGTSLKGQITVENPGGDDDFIGFVLGYDTGDLGSASADYILIDWKKQDQNYYGGLGKAGLAVSRVSGAIAGADAWRHINGVSELQRATNLGSTGWVANQTYSFELTFTASLIEVFVDGVKELSVAGTFENGSFGFYNFSQQGVRYAGLEEDILPPEVPLPAALPLLLGAIGGLGLIRRKRRRA